MSVPTNPDFAADDWTAPAGPSEDFKCGYTAGYDQAQFDLAQGVEPRTLRDEFAVQAFGPILAFKIAQFGHPCTTVYENATKAAYEAADIAAKGAK